MKIFRNIYLVGSSHVASQSIKEVKINIETLKPDIVAIELDAGRAYAMKHNIKKQKKISLLSTLGLPGFIFYLIGEFIQKKIGKIVNIEPGSEMLAALEIAEKNKYMVVFIDRDISITLTRFSKHFRKRELLRMIMNFIFSPFKKNKFDFDISKVPSEKMIEIVLEEAKKRYPSLYKTLIQERDLFMAKKLYLLSSLYPGKKIFAVVGAGHVKGIMNYLVDFPEVPKQV